MFTAFIVLFLEPWSSFFIDWKYGCQDMSKNVYSPALKVGLQHSQLYFRSLDVILLQLEVLWPRYRQKRLFVGFEIGLTAFSVIFFEHRGYFASIGGTVANIRAKTFTCRVLN